MHYCQEIVHHWQSCLAAESDRLPQDVVRHMSEMVRLLPRAWERYFFKRLPTRRQLIAIHCDAYLANFLTPRIEGAGRVSMMDWQSSYAGIGGVDRVIMGASFWTPAQYHENKLEEPMLRRYLATPRQLEPVGVIYSR